MEHWNFHASVFHSVYALPMRQGVGKTLRTPFQAVLGWCGWVEPSSSAGIGILQPKWLSEPPLRRPQRPVALPVRSEQSVLKIPRWNKQAEHLQLDHIFMTWAFS